MDSFDLVLLQFLFPNSHFASLFPFEFIPEVFVRRFERFLADNAVNGVPSCANDLLLTLLLRNKWGFQGYVTSDSGAIQDIYDQHHYLPNSTETVGAAIKAGCNMESNLV